MPRHAGLWLQCAPYSLGVERRIMRCLSCRRHVPAALAMASGASIMVVVSVDAPDRRSTLAIPIPR